MGERLRHFVLRILRVPPEPQPPLGAPGSVRVFRAGRNYFKLRLLRWGLTQFSALLGIMVSIWFFGHVRAEFETAQATGLHPAAPKAVVEKAGPGGETLQASQSPPTESSGKRRARLDREARTRQFLAKWPAWIFPLVMFLEYGAILVFVLQIPVTLTAARLEFEQHWYIVTDRSLRIRTGVYHLSESTMSFANLQQVEVKQGPVQRLLGLADVRVQSAGGGGGMDEKHAGDSLHTGIFHSVENASEIRDLILERLRRFRAAGLGDPDDPNLAAPAVTLTTASTGDDALAAAQELLVEAKAMRAAVERSAS